MEQLVQTIQKAVGHDLRQLHDQLCKQGNEITSLCRRWYQEVDPHSAAKADGGEPRPDRRSMSPVVAAVNGLDLGAHSLGMLHLLAGQAECVRQYDLHQFLLTVRKFLLGCDVEQVCIASKQLVSLCHHFMDLSVKFGRAAQAIKPLYAASVKLAPTSGCLTPIHADMLFCCIMSKCYQQGARYLDQRRIHEVQPRRTSLTPPNYLRYFYYGGQVYIALKRWKDATEMLNLAVSAPASQLSAITLEAYKKLVLVSLIQNGTGAQLPRYTPNQTSRNLRNVTPTYTNLVDRVKAGDQDKLQTLIREKTNEFASEGNLGLVKQVAAALTRRKILKLTHTYMTLSLQDIAGQAGLGSAQEAEAYVLDMVDKGVINATIEMPAGTVSFQEDSDTFAPAAVIARLEREMAVTLGLADHLQQLDARVATSHAYLSKADRGPRGGGDIMPSSVWADEEMIAAGGPAAYDAEVFGNQFDD